MLFARIGGRLKRVSQFEFRSLFPMRVTARYQPRARCPFRLRWRIVTVADGHGAFRCRTKGNVFEELNYLFS